MSNFTRQYNQLLTPEGRISKSLIRPRNIYRIVTYKDAEPATKSGENARYVFVIGKLQDRIHCIKINPIKPIDFTKFLNRIRDKKKAFKDEQYLDELLKDFTKDGKSLFETYIKNDETGEYKWKKTSKERFIEILDYYYYPQFELLQIV